MSDAAFEPWDASDDEIAQRSLIRELLPVHIRETVADWVLSQYLGRYSPVTSRLTQTQAALHIVIPHHHDSTMLRQWVHRQNDRSLLRLADYLLAAELPTDGAIVSLRKHLDLGRSAVRVVERHGVQRLAARTPGGVDELAEAAARGDVTAGVHLRSAWEAAYALEPDVARAFRDAVRAVEAAAGPVVTPKAASFRLGQIHGALRDQTGWRLVLGRGDGAAVDHGSLLSSMVLTLIVAESDRHPSAAASTKPEVAEAQAQVQLAATLVGWFVGGAVVREE